MFLKEDDGLIDYDRKTPYEYYTIEVKDGVKYRIIHTVRRGVADSRIITYEVEKIGETGE